MEFVIPKKNLLECLNHFQSVVEKRNTIPILSNIRISTVEQNNELEVTATDLALELTEKLAADIKSAGGITLPSQLFFDIVRKAPENSNISIKKDEKTDFVYISFGESKFSVPSLPVDDFPVMDINQLDTTIEIESDSIKDLIDNCKFCMGLDESRQYLNGIYFHQTEGFLTCVATDGHRLSRCQIIKDADLKNFDGIIIPKKTIYEISKILEGSDEILEVSFSKTKIQLKIDKIKITSKLLSANFPDYESVIPKDNNLIMITDCIAFAETIDRVSTVSAEKFRTVKLDISEDKCVVSSFGQEKSAGTEQIKVKYSGPSININFNAKYILDVLNIFKSGEISFTFSESTDPTTLKSTKKKNSLYLIMQMRS